MVDGAVDKELSALYGAFLAREGDPLPELKLQYADYAVWQRKWMEGEILRRQAEYWKATLEGVPELLELPADHHAAGAAGLCRRIRWSWCWMSG